MYRSESRRARLHIGSAPTRTKQRPQDYQSSALCSWALTLIFDWLVPTIPRCSVTYVWVLQSPPLGVEPYVRWVMSAREVVYHAPFWLASCLADAQTPSSFCGAPELLWNSSVERSGGLWLQAASCEIKRLRQRLLKELR